MDIENLTSELKMDDLFFPECFIKREREIQSEKLNIDINRNVVKVSEAEYDVTVKVTIDKPSKDLEAIVVAKARFSIDDISPQQAERMLCQNTVAIMFPFIRSQISLMTTQPGLTPVVLPPINTTKFID